MLATTEGWTPDTLLGWTILYAVAAALWLFFTLLLGEESRSPHWRKVWGTAGAGWTVWPLALAGLVAYLLWWVVTRTTRYAWSLRGPS